MKHTRRPANFFVICILTLLPGGLLAIMNLLEWYKIGILKQTDGYPFGGEGPVPYYYRTADLYASVNLIWGLAFLLTMFYGIWTIIKVQMAGRLLALWLTLILFAVMCIHGQIGSS